MSFLGRGPRGSLNCSGKKFITKIFYNYNILKYYLKPYLDTTTSKQVEYTKAFEITIIKELGKMTP